MGTKTSDANSLRPAPVLLALGGSSGRLLALKYLTFGTKMSNLKLSDHLLDRMQVPPVRTTLRNNFDGSSGRLLVLKYLTLGIKLSNYLLDRMQVALVCNALCNNFDDLQDAADLVLEVAATQEALQQAVLTAHRFC